MMKAFLESLTVFATLVTLCNTQCYLMPNTNFPNDVSNECNDANGVTHPLNSRWRTENCEVCFCSQEGIDCCNMAATPVNYDTVKCEKILNKETCTYTVVEREDPEKTCDVSGWMM
ncbi:beta-microseminoprotein [Rhinolophus sinicus]|uniref:beta-microseminoprotein n=1 Tax=Rhinolophus sinicus TaxID=89399 RepID=UPI0009433A27|nr:PREDICTED: beta-microseminoprotein [Rhinolophus sinicus]